MDTIRQRDNDLQSLKALYATFVAFISACFLDFPTLTQMIRKVAKIFLEIFNNLMEI